MVSKTKMLDLVRDFRWRDVSAALVETPSLKTVKDKRGRTWLHLCCAVDVSRRKTARPDSIKTAIALIEAGLDINDAAFTEGKWRATPLWYAVAFGKNIDLASYLLQRGCDPDPCLYAAAWNDDAAAIRLLIHNGAEIPRDKDGGPFLAAIRWKRFLAAEELLKLGADIDSQDRRGTTALHYLITKGDKKHTRMLLDYGAGVDIQDSHGRTAAALMARKRDPEFRKMVRPMNGR